jgi:hypothetical protein
MLILESLRPSLSETSTSDSRSVHAAAILGAFLALFRLALNKVPNKSDSVIGVQAGMVERVGSWLTGSAHSVDSVTQAR